MRVTLATVFATATAVTLALALATYLDPVPLGLRAEHDAAAAHPGASADTLIDPAPSTNHLLKEWNGQPPASFTETWTGAVCLLRGGVYRFAADADGPAAIVIDGQPIGGAIALSAGAHQLLLGYAHHDGPIHFEFLWARGDEALAPVPGWALRPHKIHSVPRLMARAAVDRALALSEWVWVGLLVLAAAALARAGLARLTATLAPLCAWHALLAIVAASFVLNAAGIWWGLPATWVAIELKPQYVLGALDQHFSHGWFDAYPPVHYYVLNLAWSPLLILERLDRITFDSAFSYWLLVLISRGVSVVMAAGMLVAACLCATRAFGRRAGIFAVAAFALVAPFVYYAKTANVDVPYLFWWALSMVFYLRLLEGGLMRDYLLFAATTTLSVCTKDQAFALYLLPPLVIVEQIWRTNRTAGVPRAFVRALVDRRLIAAAATSAVLFALCQNLLFNAGGFMDHVRFITGPGNTAYRVYPPTAGGHVALLRETVQLIEMSMGWPLFVAGIAGLAIAIADARLRRTAIWLIVPVVSYYAGFIDVILYNYDRFVLPMCFVLAIFGGLAIDRLLSLRRPLRGVSAGAIAAGVAYTLLYAGSVDVLMIRDSRYDAERWMREHVRSTDRVAVSGLREYLPRLDEFRVEDIGTIADLTQEQPEYVLLNADYARAVPSDTDWGKMIAALQHHTTGYQRVAVFRQPSPWPWLPAAHPYLVGPRRQTVVSSTLRNINPTIEIFQREP
jgi:hypothetical protein